MKLDHLQGERSESISSEIHSAPKYTHPPTHHNVQNELLDIKAGQVLSAKLEQIQENDFFTIVCDEYTDKSNKEQMTFCVRTVDEYLEVEEDFLGFYEVHNIKSDNRSCYQGHPASSKPITCKLSRANFMMVGIILTCNFFQENVHIISTFWIICKNRNSVINDPLFSASSRNSARTSFKGDNGITIVNKQLCFFV